MPDDEDDFVCHKLLGRCSGLIRIAKIIGNDQSHRLAKHAALRIDVVNRKLCASLQLLADPGQLAGHRAGSPDQNFRLGVKADQVCQSDMLLGKVGA